MKEKLNTVFAVIVVGGLCGGYLVARIALHFLLVYWPLETLGAVGAMFLGGIAIQGKRDRAAAGRIEKWVPAGGWAAVPVDQRWWPWSSLIRKSRSVVVDRAWTATIDGLVVTVGELNWDDNALDGAVVGWKGHGVFVVVGLPVPTEPMALRRPHRTVGESHRLDRPALHDAFENGEIPPWTARDQELFTFQAIEGRLRPEHLDDLVRRTLLVVRLLDLGPDLPVPDGSALPPVPDGSVAAGGGGAGQVEGGVGRGGGGDGRLGERRGG